MATLYVTEFSAVLNIHAVGGAAAFQPPVAEQTVSIGGASTASSAFNNGTRLVRLHTDAICSIEFGTSPTADATKARMAAGQTEYFAVPEGKSYKVAVITNT